MRIIQCQDGEFVYDSDRDGPKNHSFNEVKTIEQSIAELNEAVKPIRQEVARQKIQKIMNGFDAPEEPKEIFSHQMDETLSRITL